MPCTAKKYEANRPEMRSSGYKDVDYVLTTRELARMIKQAGVDFNKLKEDKYDSIMGVSTGAAVIFGATGGVMEAALRTAYEIVTGREVPFENLNITPVRGIEGVRLASVLIENCKKEWSFLNGVELKCAVAHGLVNARALMNGVKRGEINVHFIEVMACPGGCLGGGGQPIPTNEVIRRKAHRSDLCRRYVNGASGNLMKILKLSESTKISWVSLSGINHTNCFIHIIRSGSGTSNTVTISGYIK